MAEQENKFEFHIKSYDDTSDIKWLTGTKNVIEFHRDFKDHAQLKRWCEENCSDVVVFVDPDITAEYNIPEHMYFFNEADAMACKLRWSE